MTLIEQSNEVETLAREQRDAAVLSSGATKEPRSRPWSTRPHPRAVAVLVETDHGVGGFAEVIDAIEDAESEPGRPRQPANDGAAVTGAGVVAALAAAGAGLEPAGDASSDEQTASSSKAMEAPPTMISVWSLTATSGM